MVETDGSLHSFGDAPPLAGARAATVAIDTVPGGGLLQLLTDGRVVAHGGATSHGHVNMSQLAPGERVSAISARPAGDGYWVFTSRGRAIAFGLARHHGDVSHLPLNGPVIASVAIPSGDGYYMIGSDGGVFAFGDAEFRGSMGGKPLNEPVVGIAPASSGADYWLVAADGGIFSFGAPFRGSLPGVLAGVPLNEPIIGALAYGDGYVLVASDGGAFVFSDRPFLGSLGGSPPAHPIVGLAITR